MLDGGGYPSKVLEVTICAGVFMANGESLLGLFIAGYRYEGLYYYVSIAGCLLYYSYVPYAKGTYYRVAKYGLVERVAVDGYRGYQVEYGVGRSFCCVGAYVSVDAYSIPIRDYYSIVVGSYYGSYSVRREDVMPSKDGYRAGFLSNLVDYFGGTIPTYYVFLKGCE